MKNWAYAILLGLAIIVTAAVIVLAANPSALSVLPFKIPVIDTHNIPTIDAHTIMGMIPTRY
jgi:hypothetical protein